MEIFPEAVLPESVPLDDSRQGQDVEAFDLFSDDAQNANLPFDLLELSRARDRHREEFKEVLDARALKPKEPLPVVETAL